MTCLWVCLGTDSRRLRDGPLETFDCVTSQTIGRLHLEAAPTLAERRGSCARA
jgi:hypothetical protein